MLLSLSARTFLIALACTWSASPAMALVLAISYAGIGTLTITDAGGAIIANFTPTDDRTLAELEHDLGQDHLNFFQKVLSDTSEPEFKQMVDPPKGGGVFWGDARPWFWNEEPCPSNVNNCDPELALQFNIINDGKTLRFADEAGIPFPAEIKFATFL